MLVLLPLVLLTHLIILFFSRFTLWPEMVVYPFLLNNGFLLYKDIINPYPPFLSGFLTTFSRVFGYNPLPYQILTWAIILIIDIIIFTITKKIFQKTSHALMSTLFFIILSIPFSINGLWFDLVQTPITLIAFYYFYKFIVSKKQDGDDLFFSIFFLTIAFFIKQQVLWLLFWFLIVLIFKFGKKISKIFLARIPYLIMPFLILLLIQLVLFWQKGLLADFLYWTYYFPFVQASKMPGYILLPTIRQIATLIFSFLLFVPIIFKRKFEINLIIITAAILILFAYPRFDYFHLIPSLSILSLAAAQNFKLFFKSNKPVQIIFIASFLFLSVFTIRYITKNWTKEVRFFEKDIFQTASILEKITTPQDSVYIQNGPDQLLPLTQRTPPKPWADEFPWYLELNGCVLM